ncbi:TPA: Cox family DNA-binding protein [Enterobacter hormaechei]
MEDIKLTPDVEISCLSSDETGAESTPKQKGVRISEHPSDLLSKEGFALYIGKTPRAVAEMAKAGKLPAFYMADPLKPGGHAELWINRREWDKYAAQLVEEAPTEWHDWKNRISYAKSGRGRSRAAA